MIRTFLCTMTAALLTAHATSQTSAKPTASNHEALLVAACQKMAKLSGVVYRTTETIDDAMTRRIHGLLPAGLQAQFEGRETEVEGHACNGVIEASLHQGEDEIIMHAGRMIARKAGEEWKLCKDRLAGGDELPFILDPELLFDIINGSLKQSVPIEHASSAKYRGDAVTVIGITLTDDLARNAIIAGLCRSGSGPAVFKMVGGNAQGPATSHTIDLAFYIDPESRLISRIRIKAYDEGSTFDAGIAAANVQILRVGGGKLKIEEEVEEIQERDADGKRLYKGGLPIRTLKGSVSLVELDIAFSDHGMSFSPTISPDQRRLLKLPTAR